MRELENERMRCEPHGRGKWENERMRKWENGVNANNTTKGNGRVGQVRGEVEGFGRKRKGSEESWEKFWWKKGVRWVGLAYRELIGSLYESWTIGIERVYKWLINSIIQQG